MHKSYRAWRAKRILKSAALGASLGAAALAASSAYAQEETTSWAEPEFAEFYGNAQWEGVVFAQDPAFAGQERDDWSFAAEPSLLLEWRDGDVALLFTPFLRYDAADDRRTHFDLREAKLDVRQGDWEVGAGLDFVFWGRTEAVHLVDVINTVDGVEGIDEEAKLGQPMLRVTRHTSAGSFSGFYMPYFRERTFPGEGGRFRSGLQVNEGDRVFRNAGGEWAPSFAARWAHVVGDYDVGAHAFHGVSRDAALEPFTDSQGETALRPVYDIITQAGVDGQYTSGPALWKLEAIYRLDQLNRNLEEENYAAVTGGLEYTLFGVAQSNADLGLILEGAYDSRGDDALTPFNNDVVGGLRLALNDERDTSVLATTAFDVKSGSSSVRLEAERRILEGWKMEIEAQAFLNTDSADIEASLEDDSFIRLKLSYFW